MQQNNINNTHTHEAFAAYFFPVALAPDHLPASPQVSSSRLSVPYPLYPKEERDQNIQITPHEIQHMYNNLPNAPIKQTETSQVDFISYILLPFPLYCRLITEPTQVEKFFSVFIQRQKRCSLCMVYTVLSNGKSSW